jgi:hypothetical protein
VLAVAAALLAAAALALVGVAVLDTADDARAHRGLAASPGVDRDASRHERPLDVRIGEAMLGVRDQRAFFDAVGLAKAAAVPGTPESRVLELRAEAMAVLGEVVRGDGDAGLRSRAANLLGTLLFEDAKLQRNPRRSLENALFAFQDAVRLDPTNAVAQANLELLATIPARTEFRQEETPGADASASPSTAEGY